MFTTLLIVGLLIALGAVAFAVMAYQQIMTKDAGTDRMKEIAKAIQDGGKAFLNAEYRWLSVFVVIVFIAMIIAGSDNGLGFSTAIAFVIGAVASGVAGYFGMHTATRAAVRTTQAARSSLSEALDVSFKSGTVMGMIVVGLGLGGLCILILIYGQTSVADVLGFSFGASSIALFARVGGGIYTKAADVGADLVGKVEAGIPEDDPRNPATIADNVGDNVGDVAGMGADLFESYVGAILATILMGFAVHTGVSELSEEQQTVRDGLMIYPIALAAVGIICSFIGTFFVKAKDEHSLHAALFNGLIVASVALVAIMALVTLLIAPTPGANYGPWGVYGAMVIGLALGVIIGKITEYYTSEQMGPAQEIAKQSQSGAATNIIYGLATGMASTWAPVILLAVGIYFCNDLAGPYGICIAAVGMLSTLGISLGVDAYGPVADNAGGLAEMAGLDPEVRKRTDALDAVGNTTAAIGKGFAIGSAALTALALFNTYQNSMQVQRDAIDTSGMSIEERFDLAQMISLNLGTPTVVVGLLIGAMLPFLFSAMAMKAVGNAANDMVEEVRRQFKEIPGIMEGTGKPDYERCVEISTKGSLKQMVMPGLLAVIAPIAVGMIFGPGAVGGLLAGALGAGVMMALFMANAGGAWDNAKKYIEGGALGGKGSEPHKAAVTGDTVGDPFKDTAGPSINILVKLMSIVSVLALPLFL